MEGLYEQGGGVEIKMGKPTETTDLSLWELKDSTQTARKLAWTDLGPVHLGDNCVAWSFVDLLVVEPGSVPDA